MPLEYNSHWSMYLIDAYTITITTADVLTDGLVMMEYYKENRQVFFWIGIGNLVVVQLCYCYMFMVNYAADKNNMYRLLMALIVLPISPFLPFILYWTTLPDNSLLVLFHKLDLLTNEKVAMGFPNKRNKENVTYINEQIVERLDANLGFVVEAFVEAFPQSLIQSIALIYTSQFNPVKILSIMLSLINLVTKLFMYFPSLHLSLSLFNCFSVLCDHVGMFVILCWVFLAPTYTGNHLEASFFTTFGNVSWFGQLWFCKIFVCNSLLALSLPLIFCGKIATKIYAELVVGREHLIGRCEHAAIVITLLLFVVMAFGVGSFVLFFVIEIPFFSAIAFHFHFVSVKRYKYAL
ncbi:hypothetical protein RFI_27079 [Reticulomyxa filosa]|uniref:XK-related protein n=1 Tax=Reticulomyxa filosa TaxID=46433 RepID=X6M9Z2_RETFI|nr:hypothetical protein RFI_27079 [Reticulomyxa filosa]|eukprot:ETO10297.1 hypothetical protein RFI_27079 [Reticulomyxa filosa]